MKKILVVGLIFLLSLSLTGCNDSQMDDNEQLEQAEKTLKYMVESFGTKLQKVSLLAPKDILDKRIEENYKDCVSPALLKKWKNNPQNIPGRLTSSPWPDHIDIISITRLDKNTYEVQGEIIERTRVDEIAAKRFITLTVKKIDGKWLIDAVLLGDFMDMRSIIYQNHEYGFNFILPKSWEGYQIITDEWQGLATRESGELTPDTIEAGPQIFIRHPEWTSEKQRQDIPIMVFTLKQWEALEDGRFHIGAAPVQPKELGRNKEYAFALPPRYNFAFPTGYEEVEDIFEKNPLHIIEN